MSKTATINLRLTPAELAELRVLSAAIGMSTYIRAALIEARVDRSTYFRDAILAVLSKQRFPGRDVPWRMELQRILDDEPAPV